MKAPTHPGEADAADKKWSARLWTIRSPDPGSLSEDWQSWDLLSLLLSPATSDSCSVQPAVDPHCHEGRGRSAFSPRLVPASTAPKGHEGFLPRSSAPSHRGLFLRTPATVPRYPAGPS